MHLLVELLLANLRTQVVSQQSQLQLTTSHNWPCSEWLPGHVPRRASRPESTLAARLCTGPCPAEPCNDTLADFSVRRSLGAGSFCFALNTCIACASTSFSSANSDSGSSGSAFLDASGRSESAWGKRGGALKGSTRSVPPTWARAQSSMPSEAWVAHISPPKNCQLAAKLPPPLAPRAVQDTPCRNSAAAI